MENVEGGESVWEVAMKSAVAKGRVVTQFKSLPSPFVRLSREVVPYLPTTERETPLQMEISLINVNVSYKRVTSTPFSEFLLVSSL